MRKLSTQCMDDLEKKSEKCPGGEKFASEANDGFLETVCEAYQAEPAVRPEFCGYVLN